MVVFLVILVFCLFNYAISSLGLYIWVGDSIPWRLERSSFNHGRCISSCSSSGCINHHLQQHTGLLDGDKRAWDLVLEGNQFSLTPRCVPRLRLYALHHIWWWYWFALWFLSDLEREKCWCASYHWRQISLLPSTSVSNNEVTMRVLEQAVYTRLPWSLYRLYLLKKVAATHIYEIQRMVISAFDHEFDVW